MDAPRTWDARLPSAPWLLSLLTSWEDNSSPSFPNGSHYRCCSADTVADELLKTLHYYSALSLPPPSLPCPRLARPTAVTEKCLEAPSQAEAAFSTPPLPPQSVFPTEVEAGRRQWVPPRPRGSRTRVPAPASAELGELQRACGCSGVFLSRHGCSGILALETLWGVHAAGDVWGPILHPVEKE